MELFGRFSKITEDPELLRLLYDSNPTLVFVKDRNGRFVFANKALADVYDVSVENLMGKTDADFNPDIDEIEHFIADDLRVMDEQKELFIPQEKVTGPDGSLVWLQTTKRPLIEEDGSCNHILGVCVDITERIAAEERERNLRKRLERYHRLDSLGVMAGGIAHDLNNILGPLVAYPDLLRTEITDEKLLRMIDQMDKSTGHAVSLIDNLLTLARRGNYKAEPLSVSDCLQDFLHSAALDHIQSEHPTKSLQIHQTAELPSILGSATHMHQILLNLVKNAFEAIPDQGTVSISVRTESFDKVLDGYEEVSAGKFCVLRIADNGGGIHPKELDRIFEPFYSSKFEGGRGTGLGLAMVYGVVKDMAGSIEVQSAEGQGTEFIIRLPVADGKNESDLNKETDLSGDARILIIDDLDIQRQLACKMLESLGYSVDACADLASALHLFDINEPYDLIVSDMQLDDEDGLDVYRALQQKNPNMAFIIASGYAESSRVSQALEEGVHAFVRKPYTQRTLGMAVKTALRNT